MAQKPSLGPSPIHGVSLKTSIEAPASRGATPSQKRLKSGYWRYLLVYPEAPGSAQLEALQARSILPLQWMPERGVIASVPDGAALTGLSLESFQRLSAAQKLSPALSLSDNSESTVLVEFHADVPRTDMLAVLGAEQAAVIDRPDLVSWQVMARASGARLAALADWDEVEYLFPASAELESGAPVEACHGALTASGRIGQLTAKVGEGWDGAGRGSVELGYFFETYTGRLSPDQTRAEVLRALAEWSRVVQVTFSSASSALAARTIAVRFITGDHGDGYPFDGRGRTLAHTFFPAPPNPEPIAGDLHLDDDEPWQVNTGIDLYSVVLHEVGHALGLGHSDNPSAVMYPYYRRVGSLHTEDVATIRELYAANDSATGGTPQQPPTNPAPPPATGPLLVSITTPAAVNSSTAAARIALSGTTTGGSGAILVTWSNHRGGSGTAAGSRPWSVSAVPLEPGENIVTVTAFDAAQGRNSQQIRVVRETQQPPPPPAPAPPQALVIRILAPAATAQYATTESAVVLSGSAGPDGAVQLIRWMSTRGDGGSVRGGITWTTSPIALDAGLNRITVSALDAQSNSATTQIDVTFTPPSAPRPEIDRTAPVLEILSPATTAFATSAATITISGTATDNTAVREVLWSSSSGRNGIAAGTASWRIPDLPLLVGINTVVIRAFDGAGNQSWRSLTVTRR